MNRFLFYTSARLFGEACLELYICRRTPDGREQVYLIPRPDNDPFYPSMLHMPGVRKIPTELDADHVRRALKEIPFKINPSCIEYFASATFKAKRGTEYADIRRVIVPYIYGHDHFYDVDHLPQNMIEHHKAIIKMMRG